MDADALAIEHLGCQFIDKFEYAELPDPDAYQISDVFNSESGFLTKHVVDGNTRAWHINQGWFDPLTSGQSLPQFLNQLTIASHQLGLKLVTTIDHVIQVSYGGTLSLDEIKSGSKLTEIFDLFHDRNKSILQRLLSASKQTRIGFHNT